jgi:hypothetical protein
MGAEEIELENIDLMVRLENTSHHFLVPPRLGLYQNAHSKLI